MKLFFVFILTFMTRGSRISYDLIRKLYSGPLPDVYHSPPDPIQKFFHSKGDITLRQAAAGKVKRITLSFDFQMNVLRYSWALP